MNYISNAFSLNMLEIKDFTLVRAKNVKPTDVPNDVKSVIGHKETAYIVGEILGHEVDCERSNLQLKEGDILYVAQYKGPRLPEGATSLPEGATITFMEVTIMPEGCGSCEGGCCCAPCPMLYFAHGMEVPSTKEK